jgi:hypothetical protein
MLRDTAIALIAARLGDRDDLTNQLIAEMQLAQTRLESDIFLPWFLLSEKATMETEIGEDRIPLPCDFLMEFEEGTLFYVDDEEEEPVPLVKETFEKIREAYPGTGAPKAYALTNGYFRLRYVPDAVYTLGVIYYQRDTVLDSNIENRWLLNAADWLIAETGMVAANWIQNDRMAQIFRAERDAARSRILTRHEARMHANMDYYMNPEV